MSSSGKVSTPGKSATGDSGSGGGSSSSRPPTTGAAANLTGEHLLQSAIDALERLKKNDLRELYSRLRNDREKATFAMMMKMNPVALTAIRKEFFVREDAIKEDEFIFIINKHLMKPDPHKVGFSLDTPEQREFGSNMYELFKDIDVNGDGDLEWQEFTTFTVEKANQLNKKQKLASLPHYNDSTHNLDGDCSYRHRHDLSKFLSMPKTGQFALLEDHKNCIYLYNTKFGKQVATINTENAPIAIEHVFEKDQNVLVASAADMTLTTYSLDDPNPNRRYRPLASWATPGVQMAIAYQPESKLLYSGGTNGNVYSWRIKDRNLVSTLSGHTDIVMSIINLKKISNVVTASLDKTIGVWDSFTNERVLNLHGHKKGVFDLSYSPDYRLIFSCGFEHDACVWSPFVNSLVYRLKGHHASLVGCAAVEGTPELITADTSGVFKLWDVRNFQCIQTFAANLSGTEGTKDNSKLTCFLHAKCPSRNALQKEDDSRVFYASKQIGAFDQVRVVHEATTDATNVQCILWVKSASLFMTVSDFNVIIWDALMGSTTCINEKICGEEISAACLDDRKRKIIVGDIRGNIGVYNASNGALMKQTVNQDENTTPVVSLAYNDKAKSFIAGYANGVIKVYDEAAMEDCYVTRTFEHFNSHPELLLFAFNARDETVATTGASCGVARLWNYQNGKCEYELNVCGKSQETVVSVNFMTPYPLVMTSDSFGNVQIWGSRGSRWPGLLLAGFLNQTVAGAEQEPFFRENDDEERRPRRIIAPHLDEGRRDSDVVIDDANNADESADEGDFKDDISTSTKSSTNSPKRNSFKAKSEETISDHTLGTMKQAKEEANRCESKWGKVSPAQVTIFHNQFIYTADDVGVLRCFEIRHLMYDLDFKSMMTNRPNGVMKGICSLFERSPVSALPPLHNQYMRYMVGKKGDATSYLGINFCWAVQAHDDRIVTMCVTDEGILTSAADRLVKMWSFEGLPIGVLVKSVQSGTKSSKWDLDLDVESIMRGENIELDGVVEKVDQLARSENLPNIEEMDFSEMEAGANTAEFTKSDLRQRIDRTTSLLGLNFPVQGTSREEYSELEAAMSDLDSRSTSSKSLESALFELKSPNSSVDYAVKLKQLSLLQRRRKFTKLHSVSQKYGKKTGVNLEVGELGVETNISGGMSAEDIAEIEHYIEAKEAKEKAERGGGEIGGLEDEEEKGAGFDDSSSLHSSVSGLSVGSGLLPQTTRHASTSTPTTSPIKKVSNIDSSIEKYSASGRRTQTIRKSCDKYNSYREMDSVLKGETSPMQSPDYRDHIMAKKAQRAKLLARTTSYQLQDQFATTGDSTPPSPLNSPQAIHRASSNISSFE